MRRGPGSRCRSSCSRRRRFGGRPATRSLPASRPGRSRAVVLATGRDGRRSDATGGARRPAVRDHRVSLVRPGPARVHSGCGCGLAASVAPARARRAAASLPVFVAFGAAGFSWFAGLAATRTQYLLGRRASPTVRLLSSSLTSRRSRWRSDPPRPSAIASATRSASLAARRRRARGDRGR